MKQNLLLLAVMIGVVLFFTPHNAGAQCPQDPQDHGMCDTLYLSVWPTDTIFSPTGPHFVRVSLYVTHDVPNAEIDSIAGFTLPLCFTHSNPAKYCSLSAYWNQVAFSGPAVSRSIFRHLPDMTNPQVHNWMMDLYEQGNGAEWNNIVLNLDGTSRFCLSMVAGGAEDQHFGPGTKVLLATLTFKLEDTMTVCIDTCLCPPNSRLAFTRSDAMNYIPRIWDDYLGEEQYCFKSVIPGCPEDPRDLGICDTLHVQTFDCDHHYDATGLYDSVRVAVYVTHDVMDANIDSIAGFVIPLTFWHQPPGHADSVIFPTWDNWNNTWIDPYSPKMNRSMFRHLVDAHTGDTTYNRFLRMVEEGKDPWSVTLNVDSHSCDHDSGHVFFVIMPVGSECQHWWEGYRTLLATLTFLVYKNPAYDTTEIGIDTTFWPPSGHLAFCRHDAYTYIPRHYLPVKDTIYVPQPPAFMAHFMTPEGEPYPFDVTISDGEWVLSFDSVTYCSTAVPETATVTYTYHRPNGLKGRFALSFSPGQTREFNFYATDLSQIQARIRPYLSIEEVGANPSLSWSWNPGNNTLTWDLTAQSSKYVGIRVMIEEDPETPPNFALDSVWLSGGEKVTERSKRERVEEVGKQPPNISAVIQDGGSVTGGFRFTQIDPGWGTIRIQNAVYNDAILIDPVPTTLRDINGTEYPSLYVDPQYAIPAGHYLLYVHSFTPDTFIGVELPIDLPSVKAVKGADIDVYPKIPEPLLPDSFFIFAENPFAHSSYSNLIRFPGDSVTLEVSTQKESDWWGAFVLPTSLTVDSIFAYGDDTVEVAVGYLYDFTINHIAGSNLLLVVVRNEYYYDRLKLEFARRGDVTGDGVINASDIVYLINYLFIGGPEPIPMEAGDLNCDGKINAADVVYLINYLYIGGPPPGRGKQVIGERF